jgi:hypothetical protein
MASLSVHPVVTFSDAPESETSRSGEYEQDYEGMCSRSMALRGILFWIFYFARWVVHSPAWLDHFNVLSLENQDCKYGITHPDAPLLLPSSVTNPE